MTHHAFHTVCCTYEMTFVDTFYSTGSNKNIFVVIGHSNNFVRNNLTDGQN